MISQKKLWMLLWSHYMLTIRKCIAVSNEWADALYTLQTTLTNLDEWSQRNNIRFNASKCKALTVTRKKNPLTYNYHLNQVQLDRVTNEKDVGVTVTRTLSWDQHVHTVFSKADSLGF